MRRAHRYPTIEFTYVVGRCAVCGGDVWARRRDVRTTVDPLLAVCQECHELRQDQNAALRCFPVTTVGWTVRR